MKYTTQSSRGALLLFFFTLLLSLFFAPALRAQILLQEDFDTAALGSPPPGWASGGNSANVDPGQACSGNAFRMNQFQNATINNLDTPDLPRGNTPGTVTINFDMRLADWNDNTQLSGTGSAFAQLFVNGAFAQDFVSLSPVSLTNGCLTQTATFTTADVPLGADFKIRFLGVWSSGDWSYVIDNVDIRVVNDECADAVLLPQTSNPTGAQGDGRFVGSLAGATQSIAGCVGTANDDVWFQFVATERSAGITVVGGDIVVELFSGSCGSLTSLRCVDASNTNEVFSYYGLNVGETYYVRVYSFGSTPLTGTAADIAIEIGTPKSVNNECASAEIITQSSATSCGTNLTMGSLEDATESQAGCLGTANDDVWYEFVATSTNITVFLQEDTDMVVQLFEGSCGSLTSLVCRDLSPVDEIFDYNGATVGNTYFLRVYSFANTPLTGTDAEFGICVFTTAPVPDNNDCNDAITLAVDIDETCSTGEDGTTNGASRIATNPRCDGISGNRIVWYSFTAAASEHFVTLSDVDLLNGTDGARSSFEVFSGTCGALTRVHCSGQMFGANPGQRTVSGLTPGADYLIRVVPVNPTDAMDFNICVTTACPDPPSDLAVNSITTTSASLTHTYPFGIQRTHIVTLDGDDPITEAVFSQESIQTTASVTGLLPATDYDYYVLETCGGANTLIGPVAFRTCPNLATGLTVNSITATTAILTIDEQPGEERDFYVMPAGVAPVFGGPNPELVYFVSTSASEVPATGLSSNTTYDYYVGQACPSTFAGPFTFTTSPSCGDVIYDTGGPNGNYGDNEDYAITICPETADQGSGPRRVSITFDEFDAENGFDGITIYDGEDTNAPVVTSPGSGIDLWSWTRLDNGGSGDLQGVTVFTTNVSGCITLQFTSDGSVTLPGFKATVNCDLTADVFSTILTTVPAGSGAVTADKGYLSAASGYMYYVKEGTGSLLALNLGNTQAKVPINGVTMVAGSGASNLGLNGCMAPYNTVPDWWIMNRTWDVAPDAAPAFPVGVRFFYTQEDFDAIATNGGFAGLTHDQLSFYKINGGDEEDLTAPGNSCHDLVDPANYQEFDPGEYVYSDLTGGGLGTNAHQAQFAVNSFSGGGGGAGTNFGGSLPIELISFTGETLPKVNRLSWVSSREENTDYHRVERSEDGREWTTIGQLAAAGNSETELNYEFTDEAPLSRALYRITTVDFDGSTSISSLVELVRTDDGNGLRLGQPTPSPTNGAFRIAVAAGEEGGVVDVRIFDGSGREVQRQQVTLSTSWSDVAFDLSNYPAGLYWVRATTNKGEMAAERIVKR